MRDINNKYLGQIVALIIQLAIHSNSEDILIVKIFLCQVF